MRPILCFLLVLFTGCGSSTPLPDAGPGFSFLSSIKFTSGHGWPLQRMRVRLTARCNGPWEIGRLRLMEGEVPPGIIFDGEEFSGSPLRGGNWLIQVRVVDPSCNGAVYDDREVWVNFSIKGSSKTVF